MGMGVPSPSSYLSLPSTATCYSRLVITNAQNLDTKGNWKVALLIAQLNSFVFGDSFVVSVLLYNYTICMYKSKITLLKMVLVETAVGGL